MNSCWAGLSYRKVAGTDELSDGEKIGCYIALGFRDYSKVPKVADKPLFSMVGYSKIDLFKEFQ